MTNASAAIELAEARIDAERDAAIAGVRGALSGKGSGTCVDCGLPIPAQRLAAAPFARRCVACQARFEGNERGH